MPFIDFKGKSEVLNHHLGVDYHELVPEKKASFLPKNVAPNLHGNLVIHGDNLFALKALLPSHAGKVDLVYIDPPYNTGNQHWVYNDNVSSPVTKDWLKSSVGKEDLTRHDKWCCMMWPRLQLLRDLLSKKGVLFVSIDDNEQHRLRMLLDEIFGEENFVTNIAWEKKYSPANDAKYFSDTHEFIMCYAKHKDSGGWQRRLLPRTDSMDSLYIYDDGDGRGKYCTGDLSVKTVSSSYCYSIVNPKTNKSFKPPRGTAWRFSQEKMLQLIEENKIRWGSNGMGRPRLKRYLSEVKPGLVPTTLWRHEDVGSTDKGRKTLKEIFYDREDLFDNPKPVELIERILEIGAHKDAVILDSFAGSGTTAHAVFNANQKDNGNRKFILVECEDHAKSITAERIRRVVQTHNNGDLLLDETGFTFCSLGAPISPTSLLKGNKLPSWNELARHVYFRAVGEQLQSKQVDSKKNFVGRSKEFEVYLIYKPNRKFLKEAAFTLDDALSLPKPKGNREILVIAPTKYADSQRLKEMKINFIRLPFEILRAIHKENR